MKFDELLKLRNKIDKVRDGLTAFSVELSKIDDTAQLHIDAAQERMNQSSQVIDMILIKMGRELVNPKK